MIPNINPQITPNVFVRLVKIPTANTPANGTPNNPVTNKNKSHKSFELEAIKYSDIPKPKIPAMIIMKRAKLTSCRSLPFPKKRCLMSIEIQADIEFKLDEMVDCAAAKMAAISNPATNGGISVKMKYGTTDDVLKPFGKTASCV